MVSKTEDVYLRLKAEIEAFDLAPGQKLSETTVAARLGASRTPVREALRRLARERLVDFAPGEVARVSHLSVSGVRDLFEFRMILEPAAARMVAEDGLGQPGTVTAFRDLAEEFEGAARRVDEEPWEGIRSHFYALTERFDQALFLATHNAGLADAMAQQRGQSKRLRRIAHDEPAHLAVSARAHLSMSRAIAEGRADDAADTVRAHLAETLETILEGLVRHVGPPSAGVHLA